MTPTVLIVDDSLTVRMDLAEAFEVAGFHPLPCGTAAEARAAVAREPVSVAILDVLLPDADGVELLKEIRANTSMSKVPILMLSTEAEVKNRVRGLQTGADDYVGKPYDTGYVVARARELLRARRPPSKERPTVLIIDDSPTFREELRRALERAGHAVLSASSGEEGLRVAAMNRPMALIVDGVMPGIDGATVVRRIRLDAALRGTPCLLLTASEDRGAELRALDAGADAFVRKEEDLEVILARLGAVLRSARTEPGEAAALLGPKRILVVDDSETYLQEIGAMLRGDGYDVVMARSGEQALEMLAVQPVDCVLLDLVMPGLGGKDTCRRIKASPVVRDIPLVMVTSVEDRDAMIEGLAIGADDYIAKSSEFEVLKARVRAQIRRKQFEDEHRRIREELLRSELEATEARAARQVAEAKAALAEELERKNEELEAFSYSVSHDLRAPLRHIDGFTGLLERHIEPTLDEEGRRYLKTISGAAKQMGVLIDDLLNFSRIGRAELRHATVSLQRLVDEVRRILEPEIAGRDIVWAIDELPEVQGDPQLLRLVLQNLIGNALKYTRTRPQARIEVAARRGGDQVEVSVRDNGVGFDMRYMDRLFGVFQRLHSSAEFEGTGIGLASVRRIVHRHGGRVWAEARIDEGACFFFALPDSATTLAAKPRD